jgi:hypothetical protein
MEQKDGNYIVGQQLNIMVPMADIIAEMLEKRGYVEPGQIFNIHNLVIRHLSIFVNEQKSPISKPSIVLFIINSIFSGLKGKGYLIKESDHAYAYSYISKMLLIIDEVIEKDYEKEERIAFFKNLEAFLNYSLFE